MVREAKVFGSEYEIQWIVRKTSEERRAKRKSQGEKREDQLWEEVWKYLLYGFVNIRV